MREVVSAKIVDGVTVNREDLVAIFGEHYEEEIQAEDCSLQVFDVSHDVIVGEVVEESSSDVDAQRIGFTKLRHVSESEENSASRFLTGKGIKTTVGLFLMANLEIRASR